MVNREKQLMQDIEKYRKLLNQKAQTTSLISEEMIYLSHKLDLLLNEYVCLTNTIKCEKQKTGI